MLIINYLDYWTTEAIFITHIWPIVLYGTETGKLAVGVGWWGWGRTNGSWKILRYGFITWCTEWVGRTYKMNKLFQILWQTDNYWEIHTSRLSWLVHIICLGDLLLWVPGGKMQRTLRTSGNNYSTKACKYTGVKTCVDLYFIFFVELDYKPNFCFIMKKNSHDHHEK